MRSVSQTGRRRARDAEHLDAGVSGYRRQRLQERLRLSRENGELLTVDNLYPHSRCNLQICVRASLVIEHLGYLAVALSQITKQVKIS